MTEPFLTIEVMSPDQAEALLDRMTPDQRAQWAHACGAHEREGFVEAYATWPAEQREAWDRLYGRQS